MEFEKKLMELADCYPESDKAALAKVLKRAQAGEDLTLAVIGGSITQGTISEGASDSKVTNVKSYASIFFEWWEKKFPDTHFKCINAGIGATDSYLGVHRVKEDVLNSSPDLVLVEFAVNDSETDFYKLTYENLVRRILLSEKSPAIMLLFMSQTDGVTAQKNQEMIGKYYGLPMVSYKNVLTYMIENNIYTQRQLSGDVVHPSALGHAIVGEILQGYLDLIYEVKDNYGEPKRIDKSPITRDIYLNSKILDSKNITPKNCGTFKNSSVFWAFPNDWSLVQGNGDITFEVTCRNLGIIYYCQTDGRGGKFDVSVDEKVVATLNADFTGGWGDYAKTQECYASGENKKHIVTIKRASDLRSLNDSKEFSVLGLLVTE